MFPRVDSKFMTKDSPELFACEERGRIEAFAHRLAPIIYSRFVKKDEAVACRVYSCDRHQDCWLSRLPPLSVNRAQSAVALREPCVADGAAALRSSYIQGRGRFDRFSESSQANDSLKRSKRPRP